MGGGLRSRPPMRRHAPLVLSIIALVGAWGGPAVAKALLGSKDIRDRSLRGRDVAGNAITSRHVTGLRGRDIVPDSLEGSDIDESTLRRVADARRAETVAGVTIERFAYADPKGESATFFEADGLTVVGFCNDGVLEATATSTVADGLVRNTVTTPGAPTTVSSDDDWDAGETLDLVAPGLTDVSGTLTVYERGGSVTVVDYLAASGLQSDSGPECIIAGVAFQTDG